MTHETTYPLHLTPTSENKYDYEGVTFKIPTVFLQFKKWEGQPIADTWGGKALIDYQGEPIFAELAIMNTAINDGWQARWLETYSMRGNKPFIFTSWSGHPLVQQPLDLIQDKTQNELLDKIAGENDTYFGCWDVIAWNAERTIFIESKRKKSDKISKTQLKWLKSGLATGLDISNFLIVEWQFNSK